MAKAHASVDIAAPASDVWQLIGGFDSLPDWLPYISRSRTTDGGRIRHLENPDGSVIVERLMTFDEQERTYSYHILDAPFPQQDYMATIRVRDVDDGGTAHVEWSGTFTPVGVSEAEVSALFQGIYEDGLKALKAHFDRKG